MKIYELTVFIITFNNISWNSILLVEETWVLSQSLTNFIMQSCIVYILPWGWIKFSTLVVIGTACIGRCKSNSSMLVGIGGLSCLTPLSTIFQLYRGSQFYWWRKPEYLEKPLTFRKSLTNFINGSMMPYVVIK